MSTKELTALGKAVRATHKDVVVELAYGELHLTAPRARIGEVMRTRKDELGFQQLVDLCGVDWPERPERFDVVCHLLSLTRNLRCRVTCSTDEERPNPTNPAD